MHQEKPLFISGQGGYHTYRIPAVTVTQRGTLLAFCEGRKHSASDTGAIDLLLRRSLDNGETWQPVQVVVAGEGHTVGNPAPVVDRASGVIWLPFCYNRADGAEDLIVAGRAPRTVWLTWSADEGLTWATPREITSAIKDPSWTWYATGPCHGIQLADGRLVIPCDHVAGASRDYALSGHAHLIYSDDHGESWRIGGVAQAGTNESVVVETAGGGLYLNCRNYAGDKRRAYAWSYDRGESFSRSGWEETLVEPICQASMIRLSDAATGDRNRILFSNPASTQRERMTVRISYDECQSWSAGKLLHAGPSAYSDLCIATDKSICCLYERGEVNYRDTLTLARFTLDWLTDGADRIA